jgi:hypothetical protein
MKGLTSTLIGFGAALDLACGTLSAHAADAAAAASTGPALERVESFVIMSRPHSWRAVDERTVIVWATPSRAYLVELAQPSYDLDVQEKIGVTSIGGRVYAKYDAVRIGDFDYPIASIYKMSREEAKSWSRES